MKDRQVSLKKVLLVSILSCLMISSTAAYLAAAAASDYYQVITGGQYPGAPSFTIYAQDGVYYAKNQYGGISWSSTDASYVIEKAAIALVSTGGNIHFAAGVYYFTSTVDIPAIQGLTISGECEQTEFTAQASHGASSNLVMFSLGEMTDFMMKDFRVYMTENQTFVSSYNDINRAWFTNLKVDGESSTYTGYPFVIMGQLSPFIQPYEIYFDHCIITNGANVVKTYLISEMWFTDCKIGASISSTMYLQSTNYLTIANCGFEAVTLSLLDCSFGTINGNWFSRSPHTSILLTHVTNHEIKGNTISDVTPTTGTSRGIYVPDNGAIISHDLVISENNIRIVDVTSTGIQVGDGGANRPQNITCVNNVVSLVNGNSKITWWGNISNTIISGNIGYLTEAYGYANVSDGGHITFNQALIGATDAISLEALNATVNVYPIATGATGCDVAVKNFDGSSHAGAVTVYYAVKAIPNTP